MIIIAVVLMVGYEGVNVLPDGEKIGL